MRIKWRDFELPTCVLLDEKSYTDNYGKFIAEPFERGFGITIGNSLRRVLTSSLEGTAVTSIKIEGVAHEFTAIPGMREDITQIVLAVKQLRLKMFSEGPETIHIDKHGKGEVAAADIITNENVEVVNKDLHIATLSDDITFHMEMKVKKGRGYVTAEQNEEGEAVIGVIPVDSIFSPVLRTRYKTENTRVGQMTNYDKLILEIWTDGTITAEMALVEASSILRKHYNPFVKYFDIGNELELEKQTAGEITAQVEVEEDFDLKEKLDRPITSLNPSVRVENCFVSENIKTIRDLVKRTEAEMLKVRNLGKTSLMEIKKKITDIGLSFGMDI